MPQKVNTQDATNFLNNGYVSRTQASRDGAGNIKLSVDASSTENSTITVESVTSQFNTDTALKLFDTRFEYFKFPVQTVAASSLSNIGTNINQEAADALAGVSFEQDVITRRMELVPLVAGSDKIDWPIPTPYYLLNFQNAEDEEAATEGVVDPENRDGKPRKFLTQYQQIMNDKVRFAGSNGDANITYYGLRSVPLTNSNSPKGNGWFRVTPEMMKQLKAGGRLSSDRTAPYKRNIKFKFSCNWFVPYAMVQSFSGNHYFITSAHVKNANGNSEHVTMGNGISLIVQLQTSKWSQTWNRDLQYNEPMQPMFIQTTSPIGDQYHTRDDKNDAERIDRFSPMVATSNGMEIEYVIDSRDLFQDINQDADVEEYIGNYQEYSFNVMATHPLVMNSCVFEISVEELPADLLTNSGFGYNNNQPKTKYSQWVPQQKSDQFRSLFGKYTFHTTWIGGVRRINGNNILGFQCGHDKLLVGYTNTNSEWKTLHTWNGYKWDRGNYAYVANENWFRAGYGMDNHQYYDGNAGRHKFNRILGKDVVNLFRTLDQVVLPVKY